MVRADTNLEADLRQSGSRSSVFARKHWRRLPAGDQPSLDFVFFPALQKVVAMVKQ
jgi:hypothetical protein